MKTTLIILLCAIAAFVLALKTVFPNGKASKPCLLNYKASCSFTPISTLILCAAGAALLIIRGRMTGALPLNATYAVSIALGVVFAAGIIYFFIRYFSTRNI